MIFPRPENKWEPRASDIQWQESMIGMLTDHAVWMVPMTMSAITINKPEKTFKFTSGDKTDDTNERIAIVFSAMGWTEGE